MIISASRRTDIPAFYGAWLMNRIEAGYCLVPSAFGGPGGKPYRVDLRPEAVDAFVFWTKNLAPFRDSLAEVRARGIPFVVLHTVNGYPRALEPRVPPAEEAVGQMHELAARYGPRTAVWRYDPVLFTDATPPEFHRENFRRLAKALRGATDEVIVSVLCEYRKTRRNLAAAGREHGFRRLSPASEDVRSLIADLALLSRAQGMELTLCCRPELVVEGTRAAHCVDVARLSDAAGRPVAAKPKQTRPGCGCFESRDVGAYDTCGHGCAYCYAVDDPAAAAKRLARHDPRAEMLASGEAGR